MKTLKLNTSEDAIKKASDLIKAGKIVAFPTETVYGLGANAFDQKACKAIYKAKGRPNDNPMIVHISDQSQLEEVASDIPDTAIKLFDAFAPGPLSIILKRSDKISDVITAGLDTVAVRIPSCEITQNLLKQAGVPIAAPSANSSGKPSGTNPEDVLEDLDGKIDAIIMGELCEIGIESTVLDLSEDAPVILRPGAITKEMLEKVLEREIKYQDDEISSKNSGPAPKSPGLKYKHYSPNAEVIVLRGSDEAIQNRFLGLGLEAKKDNKKIGILNYDNTDKAAQKLFQDLREMDRQGYDLILIKALDETGLGYSVMNRILRSAGYKIEEVK